MGQEQQPGGGGDPSTTAHAASITPAWQRIRDHRFYLRDDVLYWECHGPMTLQDVIAMFEQRMALQRQHGRVFLLFDARALDSIPAETRRYAVHFKPDPPLQGTVVVFGASLLARTALSLITTASRLLGRRDLRPLHFGDDAAEAWAILERERLALRTGQPPA